MSHRKPKPGRVKVACPSCRRNLPNDPGALLQNVADALNACTAAGLDVKIHGRAVECEEGLVLGPIAGSGYVARTRLYEPFPITPPPDGIAD